MPFFSTFESQAHPGGADAGRFRVIMDGLGEIGADKGAGTFRDILFPVGGIRQDESYQLIKSGVGGGGVIGQDNGLAVAAAFDFPILRIDKPRRPAGGECE